MKASSALTKTPTLRCRKGGHILVSGLVMELEAEYTFVERGIDVPQEFVCVGYRNIGLAVCGVCLVSGSLAVELGAPSGRT